MEFNLSIDSIKPRSYQTPFNKDIMADSIEVKSNTPLSIAISATSYEVPEIKNQIINETEISDDLPLYINEEFLDTNDNNIDLNSTKLMDEIKLKVSMVSTKDLKDAKLIIKIPSAFEAIDNFGATKISYDVDLYANEVKKFEIPLRVKNIGEFKFTQVGIFKDNKLLDYALIGDNFIIN